MQNVNTKYCHSTITMSGKWPWGRTSFPVFSHNGLIMTFRWPFSSNLWTSHNNKLCKCCIINNPHTPVSQYHNWVSYTHEDNTYNLTSSCFVWLFIIVPKSNYKQHCHPCNNMADIRINVQYLEQGLQPLPKCMSVRITKGCT